MTSEFPCPKCAGEMESGFLLDRILFGDSGRTMMWASSDQVAMTTPIRPGDPRQFEVDAYRCTGCGYLELYAGMGNGSQPS